MKRRTLTLSGVTVALLAIGVPLFLYNPDIGLIPLWLAVMVCIVMIVRVLADAGQRLKARADRDRE